MRSGRTCALASLLVLLVCSTVLISFEAPHYTVVGVEPGDWAEYSVSSDVPSNFPITVRVDVQDVRGTLVTLNITEYYAPYVLGEYSIPERVIPRIMNCDVNSYTGLGRYLIAADLGIGDPICPCSDAAISQSSLMYLGGANRYIVFAVWRPHAGITDVFPLEMWYDQATGILVHLRGKTMLGWRETTLTSTSLWNPEPPDYILFLAQSLASVASAVLVGFVLAAAAVLVSRRQSSKRSRYMQG